VEIGAVYNGFCKPQSCQKQKDNYRTALNPVMVIIAMIGLQESGFHGH